MKYDALGRCYTTQSELVDLLYENPDLNLSNFLIDDPESFNLAVQKLHLQTEFPKLVKYDAITQDTVIDIDKFHADNQQRWHMPKSYKDMDIAAWILDQCKQPEELQRVGEELIMFQERGLFDLLRFLKYLVDQLRKYNIVWGVGRGSSVASYILYLIGVHKIDSIYYDLDIKEFLK